tara:strand:- start:548 stop:823 length:276 start_codon:yes stop_codon:yes gene_type:complete
MITRNQNGHIARSHRRINTQVRAELLIGDGWEAVAHAELKRLALEVATYHSQLEDNPGYAETGEAVAALKAACEAIESANDLDQYANNSGW